MSSTPSHKPHATMLAACALALAMMLSACSAPALPAVISSPTKDPNVCDKADVQQYTDATKDAVSRFDDSLQLANNTARIALAPIVRDMQSIRREAEAITVPVCAASAKKYLIDYMDVYINAFIAFMAQKPESEVQGLFQAAGIRKSVYESVVHDLTATAFPPATRTP